MVVVDSSEPEKAGELRGRLRGLQRQLGVEILWIGIGEKLRMARELAAAAGLDPELVRFGLLDTHRHGHDVGTNRNALLLAHAGPMPHDIGQPLGRIGNSGSARITPVHLHFGISWPTRPGIWWVRRGMIPPARYLDAWRAGESLSPVRAVRAARAEAGREVPACQARC